jgi:GNAT superfamily N-acetyltransferase
MQSHIRRAEAADVSAIVDLSEAKRLQYQSYQPLFWRKAEDSREKQAPFLQQMLSRDNVLGLVQERDGVVDGFVIAMLVPAPPVYAAGLTCVIDDFCVNDLDWQGTGSALLGAATQLAKERGAVQCVVVCGHLDQPKREMLASFGHTIASEWWVTPI